MTLARGFNIEEALKRWADPAVYQAMQDFADAASYPRKDDSRDYKLRHQEYERRRENTIESFAAQLPNGQVLASGIPKYGRERQVIDSELWLVISYYEDFDHAVGGGLEFEKIEFFPLGEFPSNIRKRPAWLPEPAFDHDQTYKHVTLHGEKFTLSIPQSKIIEALHKAELAGNPWLNGKRLLGDIGSKSVKLREAFDAKKFKKLIESDGKGEYRLRLRKDR